MRSCRTARQEIESLGPTPLSCLQIVQRPAVDSIHATGSFARGSHPVHTPVPCTFQDAGLESAGTMLAEKFGKTMQLMWAIGLLASGLVATICLTYAGQIIMVGLLQIKVWIGAAGQVSRGLSCSVFGQGVSAQLGTELGCSAFGQGVPEHVSMVLSMRECGFKVQHSEVGGRGNEVQ